MPGDLAAVLRTGHIEPNVPDVLDLARIFRSF
jgi:hypothetical protein